MLRQNPAQVLPQKLLKEATFIFTAYLMNHNSQFSDIYTIIELKEPNWLCKRMKNVRSNQPCISMNFCIESSSFMWVSLTLNKFQISFWCFYYLLTFNKQTTAGGDLFESFKTWSNIEMHGLIWKILKTKFARNNSKHFINRGNTKWLVITRN